jgi:hypothetical protein
VSARAIVTVESVEPIDAAEPGEQSPSIEAAR